jgi:purine-binding chemotaxis protein CheW
MNQLVLLFTLGGRRAALRTDFVHSVVELDALTPIPQAPAFVLGLSALRSHTLTVVDAAAALGIASQPVVAEGVRAAIVDHAGHRYALVVEEIDDVAELTAGPAAVPGEAGAGWQRASEGLIETDRGPALLLSLDILLAGPASQAA